MNTFPVGKIAEKAVCRSVAILPIGLNNEHMYEEIEAENHRKNKELNCKRD